MISIEKLSPNAKSAILVMVAALGYFVDIYDLILFSVVRVPSLTEMGLKDAELLESGVLLLNLQMFGMLLGGIAFGVLGDRLGRVSVLFGSILLYSVANFANAFVYDVNSYAVLRLIAGFGLAGELGAGITLVAETLPKEKRGWGTTIVASVGVCGALLAWYVASATHWRTAYMVGGIMGLCLLFLRVGVLESNLFHAVKKKEVSRGNFFLLFQKRERFLRFLGAILVGVPVWYVVGILVTLSPEFAKALNVDGLIEGGKAIFYCYAGLAIGDFASGFLSQVIKSRRKSILTFHLLVCCGTIFYFFQNNFSVQQFYWLCFFLGFGSGYWAVFATVAAEQFGTNIRSTVATSVPNFVRGSLVIVSTVFMYFRPSMGIVNAGLLVGVGVMFVAFVGLWLLEETYGTSLDFEES